MESFKIHKGIVATLNRENIDTDQIISKEFLKSIKKTGFGEALFHHWRFLKDGSPDSTFELNRKEFAGSSVLITGNNFGCGSSREHAVWAIYQYGFKAVIAPSKTTAEGSIPGFADIFKSNSSKNGLLLIELSQAQVDEMRAAVDANAGSALQMTVDLPAEKITLHAPNKELSYSFAIDKGLKQKFIEGLDDIGESLKFSSSIDAYEQKNKAQAYY